MDGINILQLNDSKTEVLVFGQPECVAILSKPLCPITKTVGTCAWNLGVIFDPALKFDKQINSVVKSEYLLLKQNLFFHLRIWKLLFMHSFQKDWTIVIHCT